MSKRVQLTYSCEKCDYMLFLVGYEDDAFPAEILHYCEEDGVKMRPLSVNQIEVKTDE